MKSTTISRSNLSKEKMAVLEALKQYKSEDSDYAPNVYIRTSEAKTEKKEELDLLWRNFNIQDITHSKEKAPVIYVASGVVVGSLLVGALATTLFFAFQVKNDSVAVSEKQFNIIPSSAQVSTSPQNETYIVQSGDTIEKILIRFYGQYSKTSESNIMKANNLTNPNKLSIGQELIIPMN